MSPEFLKFSNPAISQNLSKGYYQKVLAVFMWYVVSEHELTGRLPPTSPSLACWQGRCWERGTWAAVSIGLGPPWQLLRWSLGWKDMLLPLSGSRCTCWPSQECCAPTLQLSSPSLMLCCRLCLTVGQTLPSDGMGRAGSRSLYSVSWTCLVVPVLAGWIMNMMLYITSCKLTS